VATRGNIVPWLLASKALIHHGCTTGIEAYMLGVPVISYRAAINEGIDNDFYRLPSQLSHQCFNFEQLRDTLGKILNGELGAADSNKNKNIIKQYIAAQDGPMACERIIDVLEKKIQDQSELSKPALYNHLSGWYLTNWRCFVKWFKFLQKNTRAPSEFHRHRYPGISLQEFHARLQRFQQILDDNTKIKVEQIYDQIFRVST
jgi:hypothetical protein